MTSGSIGCPVTPVSLGAGLDGELQALVGGDETEARVEAVGIRTALVGRELHQRAAAPACLLDGPADHRRTQAPPAVVRPDTDRLELPAQRAPPGQAGDERQLERADRRTVVHGDE